MSASHSLVRNNPYLPFQCSIPGRDFYYFKYPHTLRAAKLFLRTLPPTHLATAEMRQCSKCHRYVTGAPSPGLDHQGGVQGPLCALPHHPPICTWTDTRGNPCSFHFSSDPSDKSPTEQISYKLQILIFGKVKFREFFSSRWSFYYVFFIFDHYNSIKLNGYRWDGNGSGIQFKFWNRLTFYKYR